MICKEMNIIRTIGFGAVVLIGVGIAAEGGEVIPTKERFSKELSEFMRGRLKFVAQGKSIHMEARPDGSLPLEFGAGKLEASDGTLEVGDSFAWPGCGFDRTSYEVKEVGEGFVVIRYNRGNAQRDGYEDSGEFKINFGDGAPPAGAGQADLPQMLVTRIGQLEFNRPSEIQKWPEDQAGLFQGLRKQLASNVESEKDFRDAIATIPKELLEGRKISATLEANGWYYVSVDLAVAEINWHSVIAVKKGSREILFSFTW
jgi:hypothetical protein